MSAHKTKEVMYKGKLVLLCKLVESKEDNPYKIEYTNVLVRVNKGRTAEEALSFPCKKNGPQHRKNNKVYPTDFKGVHPEIAKAAMAPDGEYNQNHFLRVSDKFATERVIPGRNKRDF